jgi:uncharacterized membrane protein YdjX (TVP38/TMEM64 family)
MGVAQTRAHPPVAVSWTTVVGFLPLTAAITYLGSRAQQLSLTNPTVWVAVAVLIGLLVVARTASHR